MPAGRALQPARQRQRLCLDQTTSAPIAVDWTRSPGESRAGPRPSIPGQLCHKHRSGSQAIRDNVRISAALRAQFAQKKLYGKCRPSPLPIRDARPDTFWLPLPIRADRLHRERKSPCSIHTSHARRVKTRYWKHRPKKRSPLDLVAGENGANLLKDQAGRALTRLKTAVKNRSTRSPMPGFSDSRLPAMLRRLI
jgi:hypothetical protein